jgi:hypothetical protein
MGAKTPAKIKEKVIKLWLSGLSRHEISKKVGTSTSNILNIVKEAKKNIPDIELLRAVAVSLRKKGWGLDLFSSAIRHRNMLYDRSLRDEQIDDLIDEIDSHCFKNEIPVSTFVSKIHTISMLSKKYEITPERLDDLIIQKETHLKELEVKIASLDILYNDKLKRKNLEDTARKNLKSELNGLSTEDFLELLEEDSVAKLLPPDLTYDQVKKASELLLYNPSELKHAIKHILIREDLPNIPPKRLPPRI